MRVMTTKTIARQPMNSTLGNSPTSTWFSHSPCAGKPSLRLFCFPHAGGSAASYHDWHTKLPKGVQVSAIQLPGRGARLCEPSYTDMAALVDAVTDAIAGEIDTPFAFFGHSMGAIVAFEVARKLRERRLAQPSHLFVSACRAPHLKLDRAPLHTLPSDAFCQALADLNGTPKEALEHRELMEMLEPMLRADFKAIETREFHQTEPLDMPLTVFAGDNDPSATVELIAPWEKHTTGGFWIKRFQGDHFYLQQQQEALLQEVSNLLCMLPRIAI